MFKFHFCIREADAIYFKCTIQNVGNVKCVTKLKVLYIKLCLALLDQFCDHFCDRFA